MELLANNDPIPLTELRKETPSSLFQGSYSPEGALAGLFLRSGDWNRAHEIAQDLHTPEGTYWHAIVHRQEPDAWNSNYWFRQLGQHPIFPALNEKAAALIAEHPKAGFALGETWDPSEFIRFEETALEKRGSEQEKLAVEIQNAEWKLLFDYCVRR